MFFTILFLSPLYYKHALLHLTKRIPLKNKDVMCQVWFKLVQWDRGRRWNHMKKSLRKQWHTVDKFQSDVDGVTYI